MKHGLRVIRPSAQKPGRRPAAVLSRRPFSLANKRTPNLDRATLILGRSGPKVHRYSNGILSLDLEGRILNQGERGKGISLFPIRYALLAYPRATHINVLIQNSEGGSLQEAEKIYCALRAHGGHVTTIADGLCASAATVILMAGDLRQATPGTRLLFHSPEISPVQIEGRWTAGRHQLVSDHLRKWQTALIDMYAERSGHDREFFAKEIVTETSMYFARAQAAGIVHCLAGEERWHAGRPYYSPQVMALLAPRQKQFAEYRRGVMASLAAGGMKNVIFGHTAFSKAGGFTA